MRGVKHSVGESCPSPERKNKKKRELGKGKASRGGGGWNQSNRKKWDILLIRSQRKKIKANRTVGGPKTEVGARKGTETK